MNEPKFNKPIVNSLGKPLQSERWCLNFAVEDAKLEGKKPGTKAFQEYVEKRKDELFEIHGKAVKAK